MRIERGVFSLEESKKIIDESRDVNVSNFQCVFWGKVGVFYPEQWVRDRLSKLLGRTLPTSENCGELETPPPRVSKYFPQSSISWHIDENYSHYDLGSVIVLLNTDFEGGELQYIDENRQQTTIPLKVGDGAVFDGRTYHCVKEITSGARWTVGAWVDLGGPR